VQSIKSQLNTLTAQREEMENQLMTAQETQQQAIDELTSRHKKNLIEIKANATVTLENALKDQEDLFMRKLDEMKKKYDAKVETRMNDGRAKEEMLRTKLTLAEEDYFNLEQKFESYKAKTQEQVDREFEKHKSQWERVMRDKIKAEAQRTEDQRGFVAELKEEVEDLKDKLHDVNKQLAQKEEGFQQRFKALQEKDAEFMREKIAKYKAQLSKMQESLRLSQTGEMDTTKETERLRGELERERSRAEMLARELAEKSEEVTSQAETIRDLERRQPSTKVAAQLARSRYNKDDAAERASLLDHTTWVRPSSRVETKAKLEDVDEISVRPRSALRPSTSARVNSTPNKGSSASKAGVVTKNSSLKRSTRQTPSEAPAAPPSVSAFVYKRAKFDESDATMNLDALLK
jgi:chromosome segregation ATPase